MFSCGAVYYTVKFKVDIQLRATEQYLPVVLFIMLNKVVPTFESVDDIRSVDIQIHEQHFLAVVFNNYAIEGGSNNL